MIKKTPIIDINTGRVIREIDHRKKALSKIDLRKLPKEDIEFTFNFDTCYFDKDGYFGAEGTGIVEAYIPEADKNVLIASFKCKISPEEPAVKIYNIIKKKIPNVTGLQWLKKEWNEHNEAEMLGRECEMLVAQGYWTAYSNLESKYVG